MPVPVHKKDDLEYFATWDDEATKKVAFQKAGSALDASMAVYRTNAATTYKNILPNLSVRDEFGREDYNLFRPDEASQKEYYEKFRQCNTAYKRIGIIRNVVDLMSDFACQGIEIVNTSKSTENILNQWAKKVNFQDRSERFLNILYRLCNVVVTRATAKLKNKEIEKLRQGLASADIDVDIPDLPEKNEIPWRYTFRNPMTLEVLGGELALFVGDIFYAIRLPQSLISKIANPKTATDKKLLAGLPEDVYNLIKSGQKSIPLDPDKTSVSFYKKDDWEYWAEPIIYSIMDDLIMLNKMKLADMTALDGAISYIRVWKLGSIKDKIVATAAASKKLADMLINNVSGGAMDLIWSDDIQLDQTKTDILSFLGNEKYVSVMNNIYAGLGIPPTLTGSATSAGFTNNFISLKTLVERLEYGRRILEEFWLKEIKVVQQALGLPGETYIKFNRMSLSDEAAEKALLIQMVDRNLISMETLQERFGEIPEIEEMRNKREAKKLESKKIPPKLGPYTTSDDGLKKIALQTGVATPSEVGLELDPKKAGEVPALKIKAKAVSQKNKGVAGQGRPKNKKDSKKRKQKRVLPRSSANQFAQAFVWARNAQKSISDYLTPIFLDSLGKKNLRMLSSSEFDGFESLKTQMLFSSKLYEDLNQDKIEELITSSSFIPTEVKNLCNKTMLETSKKLNREINSDEKREVYAAVYAIFNISEDNNGEVLN